MRSVEETQYQTTESGWKEHLRTLSPTTSMVYSSSPSQGVNSLYLNTLTTGQVVYELLADDK